MEIEDILRRAVRATAVPAPLVPWHEIERCARRARRPHWRPRALMVSAAALALAAGFLIAGSTGGSGPSPLQRASAAVVAWPPNQILHLRILTTYNFPQADSLQESWQLTSPPYSMRSISAYPPGAAGAQRVEFATDATGSGEQFDSLSGDVAETTNLPAEWRQTGVAPVTRDQMQAWVDRSHATNLGESEVDGHEVVGFESAAWRERIFVDAQTYLPVLDQSFGCGVGAQRNGYDEHYSWELLPSTPANLALLDVAAQHPAAPAVALSESGWRALAGQLGGLVKPPITPCA
jgi:hypothetical protein